MTEIYHSISSKVNFDEKFYEMGQWIMGFSKNTIGILGCGKLGLSLAKVILSTYPTIKNNLLVSHATSKETHDKISDAGLSDRVVSNAELCGKSKLIFIGLRPQNISVLSACKIPKDAHVVSLMAGVSVDKIQTIVNIEKVTRVMLTTPELNYRRLGLAAITGQYHEEIRGILDIFCHKQYLLSHEHSIDPFTVSVNLPILLSNVKFAYDMNRLQKILQRSFQDENIESGELLRWSEVVLRTFQRNTPLISVLSAGRTKEGVLDAIINTISVTQDPVAAFEAGLQKTKELGNFIL